jgi:hypothetical protein
VIRIRRDAPFLDRGPEHGVPILDYITSKPKPILRSGGKDG